jgi:N-acylglucosamine 2-epimerase
MNRSSKAASYVDMYSDALLKDVIPFWENHSIDKEYGGYFTCLDRDGSVYDTDKFVWLQARQIWMFSKLYNDVDPREEWLETAKHGITFLEQHGQDQKGQYHFSLTRGGHQLTHAFNIYSDCFAALAWNEYGKITNREKCKCKALEAFNSFLSRRTNPKGLFEKTTGIHPLSNFGLSMMTAYLASELEYLISDEQATTLYQQCFHDILDRHYDKDLGFIREFIQPDGKTSDTFDGRLINPGHNLEALWFLMAICERTGELGKVDLLTDMAMRILDQSWDQDHGGIYYFLDSKKAPLQQLEHDQKLWWVHLEALIALAIAWRHTDREDVRSWFDRLHDYTWSHFPDPKYGEWFGYLNRQGQPHLTLKGGKWKGCYHLPRALLIISKNLKLVEEKILN